MKFSRSQADVYVPGGAEAPAAALARVTHLCVAAHQDDIEIMAHAGICDCLEGAGRAFGGVVVTDGAGSPRAGEFAGYDDTAMQGVRREEQRQAARLAHYAIQIQLAHPSAAVKSAAEESVVDDLAMIFAGCRPSVVYLHNPADKHDTHVAVLRRCIDALRSLPAAERPRQVLGCEVWRDLDWLADADKVALDAGRRPQLAGELLRVFRSQVVGGKRYDLAAAGRRAANATFHTSHATDRSDGLTWAMDLTPAIAGNGPSLEELMEGHLRRFHADVMDRLARFPAMRSTQSGVSGK